MATTRRKHAAMQPEPEIPDKLYFRIGEVSELAKLPTYVLRFWESEFSQLKPTKSSTGQRMYRRRDVEFVMQIRKLLYEDGFTIAGAREKLREEARLNRSQNSGANLAQKPSADDMKEVHSSLVFSVSSNGKEELRRVRQQLCDVLDLLS